MKALAYRRTWFRRGSYRPGGLVFRFEQFAVYSSGGYRRKKI